VILSSFLIGLTLAVVGLFVVTVRGVTLWRQGKRTGGAITSELDRFEERSARTEELLAEAERTSHELQTALERLRISRARLQVLLDSLETAQRRTRWLRVFLPSR
jgi:chromosome segregation ATPase